MFRWLGVVHTPFDTNKLHKLIYRDGVHETHLVDPAAALNFRWIHANSRQERWQLSKAHLSTDTVRLTLKNFADYRRIRHAYLRLGRHDGSKKGNRYQRSWLSAQLVTRTGRYSVLVVIN